MGEMESIHLYASPSWVVQDKIATKNMVGSISQQELRLGSNL